LPPARRTAASRRAESARRAGHRGSRKRAAVKGDVTGVTITPVTAPEAEQPAQAARPAQQTASNASNGGNATK